MNTLYLGAMNVVHPVALLVLDDAVEHADHGGEADAAREENDGAVGRSVEVERAARNTKLLLRTKQFYFV